MSVRRWIAITCVAPLALSCARSCGHEGSPAPAGSAQPAASGPVPSGGVASDGIDLPPNGLCPGPCAWHFDRGGGGTVDKASLYAYHPDGRVAEISRERDGDEIIDKVEVYHYRMPPPEEVTWPGANAGPWRGVLVEEIEMQHGKRRRYDTEKVHLPYDRDMLFRGPANEPFREIPLPSEPRITTRRNTDDPEHKCPYPLEEVLDGDTEEVLLVRRSTCENGVRTRAEVTDGKGKVLGVMVYSYACWKGERGCPMTPELRPLAPHARKSKYEACRADVQSVTRGLDPARADRTEEERHVRLIPVTGEEGFAVRLYGVRPRSAIGRLGLENGDTLLSFAGVSLTRVEDLGALAPAADRLDTIEIQIQRDGAPVTWQVQIAPTCSGAAPPK